MTLPKYLQDERLIKRFWGKVYKTKSCWEFGAQAGSKKYGAFYYGPMKKTFYAHRLSYELTYGTIPPKKVIHHKCENPPCCNPKHLELTTRGQNVLYGSGPTALNARKTHCKNGHILQGKNLWISNNGRHCLACMKNRNTKRRRDQGEKPHKTVRFRTSGFKNGRAKLTNSDVDEIKLLYQKGLSQRSIANKFNVSPTTIQKVVNNKSYRKNRHVKSARLS